MIEFKYDFDKKLAAQLNAIQIRKYIPLFVALGVLLAGLGVSSIISGGISDIIVGTMYIAFAVFLVLFPLIATNGGIGSNDPSNATVSMNENTTATCTFQDDGYLYTYVGNGVDYYENSKIPFRHFVRALKAKEYYVLYTSKVSAVIFPINSITVGTIEEFDALLYKALGNSFKRKA